MLDFQELLDRLHAERFCLTDVNLEAGDWAEAATVRRLSVIESAILAVEAVMEDR